MTLLEEIQEAAASDAVPLSSVLRKCKLLAARIGSKPVEDWVDWELDGYTNDARVPDYRIVPIQVRPSFVNSAWRADDYAIPPAVIKKLTGTDLTVFHFKKSIGAIEHLLSPRTNGSIKLDLGNLPLLLSRKVFDSMDCTAAWGAIDTTSLGDILNVVRNKVLRLSTDLWKELPEAGTLGKSIPKNAEKHASQIITNIIYSNANVIGNAPSSTITQITVPPHDIQALTSALKEQGVKSPDIDELQQALKDEPILADKRFGEKVTGWLQKMAGKVASDAGGTAAQSITEIITQAIRKYYGLD